MAFNSLQFVGFLALVLLAYYRFGRRGQNALSLVAATVFYAAFDVRFVLVAYSAVVVHFLVGRAIERSDAVRRRRQWLAVSVVGQLLVLGVFKYLNFFADSASALLTKLGLEADWATIELLLPVGLSFYTFQTLAYVVAIYRRQLAAEQDLLTFATFTTWFPQIVAGPIEQPNRLLPQIQRRRDRPSADAVASALLLFLTGLFKKVVVADGVAAYVSTVYDSPASYSWSALVLATAGFAIQVYGDFSGYSDMARGVSRLLGVELRRNFEQPFLSRDIRELWTRWHTSLNWWFVEHVGRPLGGAGETRWAAARSVLVIFALIGLWHGAAWHFVVWGVINGLLVLIWRFRRPRPGRHPMRVKLREAPAIAFTFGLFCLGVAFFRAASVSDATEAVLRMVTFQTGMLTRPEGGLLVPVMALMVLLVDIDERRRRVRTIEGLRVRASIGAVAAPEEAVHESGVLTMGLARCVAAAAMIVAVILFSGGSPTPFIYRQF